MSDDVEVRQMWAAFPYRCGVCGDDIPAQALHVHLSDDWDAAYPSRPPGLYCLEVPEPRSGLWPRG